MQCHDKLANAMVAVITIANACHDGKALIPVNIDS